MASFGMIFILCVGFLLGALIIQQVYIRRVDNIRRMMFNVSQGQSLIQHQFLDKQSKAIALLLNESYRQSLLQLERVSHDKEKLQAILSSMTEGVLVVDALGNLEHVSPNIRHMLELRSQQWGDRPYWEIIRNPQINEAIRCALTDNVSVKREIVVLSTPQSYFSMQISPVLNKNQTLIAVVAVLHDITDLKQLEIMRAEFVANVSHELKTPLTSIKGFVDTLADMHQGDPQTVQKFLDIIKRQTVRLENLVNDLLTLSSLEASSMTVNKTIERIDVLLDEVVHMHQNALNTAGLHLSTNYPEHIPDVWVDRIRMEQVFINLLDNAIKFTPRNGMIKIDVETNGNVLRVLFADTGVGIPREFLSRIFEPFYRVDRARSRETGGTGLGLSIVNQIVQAHGGKVEVESILGQGSRFYIYLPLPG